jgi:hypothetical protein
MNLQCPGNLKSYSTDVNPEVKAEKTKHTLMFHNQNAGRFHNTKIHNKSLKPVAKFTYLGMMYQIKISFTEKLDAD